MCVLVAITADSGLINCDCSEIGAHETLIFNHEGA